MERDRSETSCSSIILVPSWDQDFCCSVEVPSTAHDHSRASDRALLRMTGGWRRLSHLGVLPGSGYDGQGLFQIGDQVVGIFNSHRKADQLLSYSHLLAMLGGDHSVRGEHRQTDQRIHSA